MAEYITSLRRERGGIWVCIEPVTIEHPRGRIQLAPGSSFCKGTDFMGVDLAAWLDEQVVQAWSKRSNRNRV